MTGLADLANRKYKSAAQNFMRINLDHWESTDLLTPNDIAVYGALCALATFERSEIQTYIIHNK